MKKNTACEPEKKQGRPHVLLLAYSVSPFRGSEYSVGWNHIKYLSSLYDITVIYGLSGAHMGDCEEIERYINENGELANVNFIAVRPNAIAKLLNLPNRAGFLVYSFYLAYRVWHWQAFRVARKLMDKEKIDLIHYLCPIGYREPGFLWKLGKPYVWGPIGGLTGTLQLDDTPRPWKAVLKTALKNYLNTVNLITSRNVPRALHKADVVVVATSEGKKILSDRFKISSTLLQENAIPDEWLEKPSVGNKEGPVNIIWIGSLDWRKSPDLLIDSMKKVCSGDWYLHLVGDGPLFDIIRRKLVKEGLAEQVTMHGKISRNQVRQLLSKSNLHIITSMNEANTTVIWEAMAASVPTLTLQHCGMRDVVCDRCGVLIQPSTYAETRNAIASSVKALIEDRNALYQLSRGVEVCRKKHTWSKRKKTWDEIYKFALSLKSNRL